MLAPHLLPLDHAFLVTLSLSTGEPLDVYDVNGVFQHRTHARGEPVPAGDYHRCVHIWVHSRQDRYLIQQRAPNVAASPGMWATTAGAVRAGETVLAAAVRELAEEIGFPVEPSRLKQCFESRKGHLIATVWLVQLPDETASFVLQPEEVSAVKWSTRTEILAMVRDRQFVAYGPAYFTRLFGAGIPTRAAGASEIRAGTEPADSDGISPSA